MSAIRAAAAGRVGRLVPIAAALTLGAVACGGGDGATPDHPVATFEVAGVETFKIELDTPELVEHARQLMAGEEVPAIPVGVVVRDSPGVNAPWSWHIDPATLEFADFTAEVCDGLPSYVEEGTVTSDRYCPWLSEIIAIE